MITGAQFCLRLDYAIVDIGEDDKIQWTAASTDAAAVAVSATPAFLTTLEPLL